MIALIAIPIALQAIVMLADEGLYHRLRGLPRWERIGHPLDTLTIALCLGWLVAVPRSAPSALTVYVGLAIFSTLFVTKDEPIHARLCKPGEHWLHAMLFVLHPIVLAAFAALWWSGEHGTILTIQLVVTVAFGGYQTIYWNVLRDRAPPPVNNDWYAKLGSRWYDAEDTPIALLRAEARHRNPWIATHIGPEPRTILDLGCGAGFLANDLAARGHHVTGLDSASENLDVARARDSTQSVTYDIGDACALPYSVASFDVVCAMDLLEHVESPRALIAEVARVLRPGGLFFFHTFNRTWQAHVVVIKGVELFVRNTPADLHVLRLFVTPDELVEMSRGNHLEPVEIVGSRPRFRWPLWRMLATGRVGDDFEFMFTRSTKLGYTGYARLESSSRADAGSCTRPRSETALRT